MPGLDKRTFLNQVSEAIEEASLSLLPEGFEPAATDEAAASA